MDFLADYRHIVRVNESISYLYIVYQFFLMISTVLGPATVLLMITGAYNACLGTSLWQSFVLAVGPACFYLLLCYITTSDFQIRIAGLMSAIYAVIMMAVIIGTTIQIAEDSWTSPNAIFLMLLVVIFLLAAITHPQEFWCIVPGMLYFLCIPSGYLLLIIYSLCNLNIVSWGTREVEKKKPAKQANAAAGGGGGKLAVSAAAMREELEVKQKVARQLKKKNAFLAQFTVGFVDPHKYSRSLRSFMRHWLGIESNETNSVILKQILGTLERIEKIKSDEDEHDDDDDVGDLGFINPEDIADRAERVQNYHQRARKHQQQQGALDNYLKLNPDTNSAGNNNNNNMLRKRYLAANGAAGEYYYQDKEQAYQGGRFTLSNNNLFDKKTPSSRSFKA